MIENILDKFTTHFKKILLQAQNIAWQEENSAIEPVHLLEALLQQKGCIGLEIMHKQNITVQTVVFRTPERLNINLRPTRPTDIWNLPQPSSKSQRIIELAVKTSFEYHHKYVGSEHLLVGLVKIPDTRLRTIFNQHNVNMTVLLDQLDAILKSTARFNSAQPDPGNLGSHDAEGLNETGGSTNILDMYTTNLTTDKIQKNIDPVIGREGEISRLIQILSRRTKNNPILLGDPGVGKTAIIEGLAKKITTGEVPDALLNKTILTLDLSAVVAGTMYRGEFENRLKQIIDSVKADENIILFIDEIHNIIGTGSSAGSLDAANILKPALARGYLRCIGATTHEEYKKFIENDKALERRFQVIMVEEATEAETLQILRGIKRNYETYHNVTISEEALGAAIKYSQRYMTDKKLPDKAIDLIDEAASQLKVSQKLNAAHRRVKELESNLRSIQEMKRNFILEENYSQALNIKEQEDIILQELNNLKAEHSKTAVVKLGTIGAEEIAYVVSQATRIPLTEIIASEKKRILKLEESLAAHVFGQDEAISEVAQTIKRSRSGLHDPRKPLGSFMFLGPSGVGKTETARQLSRMLFNREDALIRIDMSEFAERFNVSKLIGSPAGYVGYKEGTQLTDAVRKKPYSVVLFDEVEKAHPDVFNLLLPVLEDGYMTDAVGHKVNFRNTIIIMTSNVGLKEFTNQARLGFELDGIEASEVQPMKDHAARALKEHFRPEFLNRIDKVIVFNPLSKEVSKKIIARELDDLKTRLREQGITAVIDRKVITHLLAAFKPTEGARSLKRAVETQIVNALANRILGASNQTRDKKITISVVNNKIVFTPA